MKRNCFDKYVCVIFLMGTISFFSLLFSSEIPLQKDGLQKVAMDERDFKRAIALQREKLQQAPQDKKAAYTKELAILYLKDQDQKNAFESFLKALDLTTASSPTPSFDEAIYKKAFAIYLDPNSESPQETAKKLIETLTPTLKEKPDEHLLDYFVAIAYANLGKYEELFKHFYTAYQHYPDHYLAYKTKAVLHIKILERTRGDAERLAQRQEIMDNLLLALKREPHDTTIYRLMISFAPKEKKNEQVQRSLNKIINDNIIIPRGELMFYVIEAIDVSDPELAQRFINRSKEWYPQSRIVAGAQKYLDAHK